VIFFFDSTVPVPVTTPRGAPILSPFSVTLFPPLPEIFSISFIIKLLLFALFSLFAFNSLLNEISFCEKFIFFWLFISFSFSELS